MELDKKQVFSVIDELFIMGTRMIIFAGGEPLIRDDIGEIIDYARRKGIYTIMHTNASMLSLKIREIRNLNKIIFCLEGPRQINDNLRGAGSYDNLLAGVKIARSNGIKVDLLTVLCKQNLNCIDHILYVCRALKLSVVFQPITDYLLDKNNSELVLPSQELYKEAINGLISRKKNGDKYIRNSLNNLSHLYHWPKPLTVRCPGGLVYCRIGSNGDIAYCDKPMGENKLNVLKDGVRKSFINLVPYSCDSCWCAMRVELLYSLRLSLGCIYNFIKGSK